MSQHNIAYTKAHLSELVERALMGEEVVIARDNQPSRLTEPARTAIASDEHDILVSRASAWEMAIKAGLGQRAYGRSWSVALANTVRLVVTMGSSSRRSAYPT